MSESKIYFSRMLLCDLLLQPSFKYINLVFYSRTPLITRTNVIMYYINERMYYINKVLFFI